MQKVYCRGNLSENKEKVFPCLRLLEAVQRVISSKCEMSSKGERKARGLILDEAGQKLWVDEFEGELTDAEAVSIEEQEKAIRAEIKCRTKAAW